MIKRFIPCLLFFASCLCFAHEGHQHLNESIEVVKSPSWADWVGSFHLILLHFPIATIDLLAASEILYQVKKKEIYRFSSRFLLFAAAILAPPTALLGLVYEEAYTYQGFMQTFLSFHKWLGISTALLTLFLVFARDELKNKLYYSLLILLVLLVNSAAFFGGLVTFGVSHLLPPI